MSDENGESDKLNQENGERGNEKGNDENAMGRFEVFMYVLMAFASFFATVSYLPMVAMGTPDGRCHPCKVVGLVLGIIAILLEGLMLFFICVASACCTRLGGIMSCITCGNQGLRNTILILYVLTSIVNAVAMGLVSGNMAGMGTDTNSTNITDPNTEPIYMKTTIFINTTSP